MQCNLGMKEEEEGKIALCSVKISINPLMLTDLCPEPGILIARGGEREGEGS